MTFNRFARVLLLLLITLGSITLFLQREHFNLEEMVTWAREYPVAAHLYFIVLYVVLTALFFPSPILSLAGGVLFGPLSGGLLSLIGATLSAVTTFNIGRYLAADWLERRIDGGFREIKHGVEKKGWRFVLMLRLVPGLPFTLFNYALGLTRIHILHFASVTALCIAPRTFFLSYAGYTGRLAATGNEPAVETLFVLLLLAAVIGIPYLLKLSRKAKGL